MRLARLDLLRYGRFTDASFELPQAERDIHIVFGPNEAGKTTSLTAIEDLLFGIQERSPYNFLHSYDAMRVGAVLENGDDCFEFQRRKARRDMILGPDGEPLPPDLRPRRAGHCPQGRTTPRQLRPGKPGLLWWHIRPAGRSLASTD